MTPRQFLEQLRGNRWAPVYFFCGEEGFFHDRCRQVLLRTVPPEVRSWCVHSVDFAPGELASLLEQAYQMPMMGPRNVFLIRDVGDFSHAAEEDYEALKGYLEKPSLFSAVVFMAEEPDRRRRFVSLLLKRAEVVEMRRPEGAANLSGSARRRPGGCRRAHPPAPPWAKSIRRPSAPGGWPVPAPGRSPVACRWVTERRQFHQVPV